MNWAPLPDGAWSASSRQISNHLCQFSTLVTHQKSSKVFPFGDRAEDINGRGLWPNSTRSSAISSGSRIRLSRAWNYPESACRQSKHVILVVDCYL